MINHLRLIDVVRRANRGCKPGGHDEATLTHSVRSHHRSLILTPARSVGKGIRYNAATMDLTNRHHFLSAAILFEGALIVVAGALGAWFEVDALEKLGWTTSALGWGVGATIPAFFLFLIGYRVPTSAFQDIRRFLLDALGPPLGRCRWYELLLIAAVAGLAEELLFRGVLHPLVGLFWSNVIFAVVHSVSPLYAVLAGLMGVYLGWIFDRSDNLLAPILTHALYDFLAFLVVARDYRRSASNETTQ